MDFDQMVQEILSKTGITRDELMFKIRKKQEELGGFVTSEGAAMIVGRELGVELIKEEPTPRELKIEDLVPGMSGVSILGRVARIYRLREFQRPNGTVGKIASLQLMDASGKVRAVFWNDKASLIEKIQKGDIVQLKGVYVRQGLDKQPELNLGGGATLVINPEDPRVNDLPPLEEAEVKVADLRPGMGEVDLVGRVVAVSAPRVFERPDGSQGKVVTILLLDATGYVRVSIWDSHADVAQSLKRGDIVKLENASVRAGLQGKPELSLGGRGRLLLNPQDIKVAELPQVPEHPIKIDEIEADMPTVDLVAKVRRKFPPQDFRRSDGTAGKVMSLILSDETGVIRASFWGGSIDLAQGLHPGDILRIRNAYTRRGLGDRPEVHIGAGAKIEVNPAGVTVGEPHPSRMLLGELEPGMDAIEAIGRITEVGEVREFERNGDRGKVATLTIGDSTGMARVSLWREMTDKLKELKVGDIVKLSNAYTTLGFLGAPEIQVGRDGVIEVNPKIEEELPPADALTLAAERPARVSVGELQREGMRVQVRGTLIRMFNVRPLFDVCPTCGRSLGSEDTNPICESCGKVVKPEHRLVLSFILDDGTGSIRCVVFGETAEKLLGVNADEAFEMFKSVSAMEEFYSKFDLVGRELILSGTTRRNRYFDQLELRASEIQFPDSRQEAHLLLETIWEGPGPDDPISPVYKQAKPKPLE